MDTPTNTAQTQQPDQDRPSYGEPKTSRAFDMLFDAAAEHLTPDELDYLAGFSGYAQSEAIKLSESLAATGSLIYNAEKIHRPSGKTIGLMFFNMSNQLDHIAGLIGVASEAAYRLEKLREENSQA